MDDKNSTISRGTLIPLGVAAALCIGLITFMVDLTGKLINIEHSIKDNSRSVQSLRVEMQREFDEMDESLVDRWYRRDMIEWVERLKLSNQSGLVVPDISAVR